MIVWKTHSRTKLDATILFVLRTFCALFSCSNFTFVQENLCGNRVVEPNEDCDGYAELEVEPVVSPTTQLGRAPIFAITKVQK